jgi:hypothetical protein
MVLWWHCPLKGTGTRNDSTGGATMTTVEARQQEIDARWAELEQRRATALGHFEGLRRCGDDQWARVWKMVKPELGPLLRRLAAQDGWPEDDLAAAMEGKIAPVIRCFEKSLAMIEEAMGDLIEETMRLHPEEFTQLPGGRWVPTKRYLAMAVRH